MAPLIVIVFDGLDVGVVAAEESHVGGALHRKRSTGGAGAPVLLETAYGSTSCNVRLSPLETLTGPALSMSSPLVPSAVELPELIEV